MVLFIFFTSACQHLSVTFKGSSAVVRWLLSVSFMAGFVVFVVCFIKSFFMLSWWMPIVGLIVASILSGVLQGLMDFIFADDQPSYMGYSMSCIVGTLVSAIVNVVVFFKDTISHIEGAISRIVSLFNEWHNGLGYNTMNLYDLEDFFSVDMYKYYAHECNMCIIVLVCLTMLIIATIMLIAYGSYSDKRLLKRHFYLFSFVGIVGYIIVFGFALDFYRPFSIVFVADFLISAILGGIITGVSMDKIDKEQYMYVLFWDAIIIISSFAIGGCALSSIVA